MKRPSILTLVMCAALTLPLAAQDDPPVEQAELSRQVAALDKTLERIAVALERQVEGQKFELLMQRMEMTSDQVVALEREIEALQATSRKLDDERTRLEWQRDTFVGDREDRSAEEQQAYEMQLRFELDRNQARRADVERRISELQNRLTGRSEELREWQDYVDRELSGL